LKADRHHAQFGENEPIEQFHLATGMPVQPANAGEHDGSGEETGQPVKDAEFTTKPAPGLDDL
jgi:hypothetical protein